ADITTLDVDVIVNAANSRLAGGGGVDGAIHRRGGPEIMNETDVKYPQGCPTGSAVLSGAGNLSAKFIAHAVGPVWRGGSRGEAELLTSAYERSLALAEEQGCESIALPALSTGAYGYPIEKAARVTLSTVRDFAERAQSLKRIRVVLFDEPAHRVFVGVWSEMN
ncbi:MAG: macro domain-containing protein, partial [Planctomycetales bacterium]|nr:macro domain-containing protein [Planctomycetales bacterium]